jgi:hypothetical protein
MPLDFFSGDTQNAVYGAVGHADSLKTQKGKITTATETITSETLECVSAEIHCRPETRCTYGTSLTQTISEYRHLSSFVQAHTTTTQKPNWFCRRSVLFVLLLSRCSGSCSRSTAFESRRGDLLLLGFVVIFLNSFSRILGYL